MKTTAAFVFAWAVANIASSAWGSGGFIKLARGTDTIVLDRSFALGTNYTYEVRIRYLGLPQPPIGGNADWGNIFKQQNGWDTDSGLHLKVEAGVPQIVLGQCCGAPVHFVQAAQLSDGNWHHVAVTRTPEQFRCYIDGQLISSQPSSGSPGSGGGNCNRAIGAFRYAYTSDNPTNQSVIASIDWLRVSDSTRYDGAAFVPPSEDSLVADSSTLALFRFNTPPSGLGTIVAEGTLGVQGTCGVGFSGATSPEFLTCDPSESQILGVQPISGPAEGGTAITISGTGFSPDAAVSVGGVPALSVNYVSSSRLTAVTPQGLPGVAAVTVGCASSDAFYYRPYCGSDLDQNGSVDGGDLAILLLDWGPCYSNAANTQPDELKPFMLQEQPATEAPQSR
jgi:hypothetical protein